jgi:hypothetical protein
VQLLRQEPSGWQTPLPGQPRSAQLRHCHCPVLQMGVGTLQSELLEHPTQAPERQTAAEGCVQSVSDRQAAQTPEGPQFGVAPEHAAQVPPDGPQCAASTG